MAHLLGLYQCIIEEIFERSDSAEAVEEVGHIQCLVDWVVHHSGREVIEAEHVSHLTTLWTLLNKYNIDREKLALSLY